MKFEKLILENFSSYFGRHQIDFHTSKEKPVTIIVGGSGKGKTSIFDAINWALYGAQYEPDLEKENEKDITDFINETALIDATRSDSSAEMACTLFFENDEKHYRIQQAICIKKINNKIQLTDRSSSLYEISPTGNANEINHIESFLNEILPNNVRDYFLFNGDRINKLALPGSSEEIRDGIYRVVDLELLQSGADHLATVAGKFRKLAKDSSIGEMSVIENQYSMARDELDALKLKISDLNDTKRMIETKIDVISEKLHGMEEIKDLQGRRNLLKERLKTHEDALKNILVDLRSTSSVAILRYGFYEVDKLKAELDTKRKKGEIPSSISESLLMDILEIGKCICGTEFIKDDKVFRELRDRLLSEKEKGKKGQDLLELFFDLTNLKSEIEKAYAKLPLLEISRLSHEKTISSTDKELKEIIEKLSKSPEEEVSRLATTYREFTTDLSNTKIDIQRNQERASNLEEEIRKLRVRRDDLGAKQEKVKKFQLRDNLAQNASDELQRIFEKFAEDSRREVENFTREEFMKFIPTAQALKVGIDIEFHYDVRDQNNDQALQQLSMGQKQALSLAYITSISRVSEKFPPLVIDMPFGRLDEEVQDNIANRLPNLASQVILLVLPGSEWNEHTQSILCSRSSDIYNLEFDENSRQTTIKKVY